MEILGLPILTFLLHIIFRLGVPVLAFFIMIFNVREGKKEEMEFPDEPGIEYWYQTWK